MKGAATAAPFVMPSAGPCSDLLFREVLLSDSVVMSVRVGLHFKTGELRLGSRFELVMLVNDRCGVIPP